MDRTEDEQEYLEVWRLILKEVLQYPDGRIEKWIARVGVPLLSDPSVVYHEEPWFWMCAQIVDEFLTRTPGDRHEVESKIFFVLRDALSDSSADWDDVRERCRSAVQEH